jgi:hypothetical protein
MAPALMENRNGLLVDFALTQATGTAERETAPELVDGAWERGFHPRTLGADKSYDIDGRTTSWPGYAVGAPCPHEAGHAAASATC